MARGVCTYLRARIPSFVATYDQVRRDPAGRTRHKFGVLRGIPSVHCSRRAEPTLRLALVDNVTLCIERPHVDHGKLVQVET